MRLSKILVAALLIWGNLAFAASVTGILINGATTSYEGYLFDVYEITVKGKAPFAVEMSSEKLDSYLVVVDPNGKIQTNDDGSLGGARRRYSGDAALEFAAPAQGRWLVFATTLQKDQEGQYRLFVLGEDSPPTKRNQPTREEVARAFSGRGIRDTENVIVSAFEQLTLKSFRTELISRLRRERDEKNKRIQAIPSESDLPRLENLLAQITSAQAEAAQLLTASNKFVGELLAKERASIEHQIDSSKRLMDATLKIRNESLSQIAALSVALTKLEHFDSLDSELKDLETLLIDKPESATDELRNRLLSLRSRRAIDGRTLAELLIKSRMISPNSTSALHGYTLYSELNGQRYDEIAMARAFTASDLALSRLQAPLGVASGRAPLVGATLGALLGGVHSSLVGRIAGAGSSAPQSVTENESLNTSVWLPALLPWPPPTPSSQMILDRAKLVGSDKSISLGELDGSIQAALAQAGYSGSTYWGVPSGYALVTPLEQTDQHGAPLLAGSRWNSRIVAMKEFSLAEYLRVLLTAPVGYFRILLFVVSSETFASRDAKEILATVEHWTRGGLNALPDVIARRPFSESHRVNALVYEFVKQEDKQRPRAEVPGRLKTPDHLRAVKFSYFAHQ